MSFREVWPWIREKFPPARFVTFIVGPLIVPISIFNGWLANHAPLIAEQVGPDQVTAIVIATAATLAAMLYKFLDGQAKWEGAQISAHVGLAQADKISDTEAKEILEPPPIPREERKRRRARQGAR